MDTITLLLKEYTISEEILCQLSRVLSLILSMYALYLYILWIKKIKKPFIQYLTI